MAAESAAAVGKRCAVTPVVAACLVLAGCGATPRHLSSTPGATATRPDLPRGPVAPALTRAPATPVPEAHGPLAGVDACSLAPTKVLGRFGATGSGIASHRDGVFRSACDWQVPGRYVLGIAVSDKAGLGGLYAAGQVTRITIGGHPAITAMDRQTDTCTVSLGVAPHARVDIDATGNDRQELCDAAGRIARAVEPRLPRREG